MGEAHSPRKALFPQMQMPTNLRIDPGGHEMSPESTRVVKEKLTYQKDV